MLEYANRVHGFKLCAKQPQKKKGLPSIQFYEVNRVSVHMYEELLALLVNRLSILSVELFFWECYPQHSTLLLFCQVSDEKHTAKLCLRSKSALNVCNIWQRMYRSSANVFSQIARSTRHIYTSIHSGNAYSDR